MDVYAFFWGGVFGVLFLWSSVRIVHRFGELPQQSNVLFNIFWVSFK